MQGCRQRKGYLGGVRFYHRNNRGRRCKRVPVHSAREVRDRGLHPVDIGPRHRDALKPENDRLPAHKADRREPHETPEVAARCQRKRAGGGWRPSLGRGYLAGSTPMKMTLMPGFVSIGFREKTPVTSFSGKYRLPSALITP